MEGDFEIVLANARQLKAIPRKETDIIDCKRIANLLRYGLVPNSFIPPKEIRVAGPSCKQIKKMDEEIERNMVLFQKESKLIQTIPGISDVNTSAILAEIGVDMSQFPDEAHLSSWAGVCPGNNESAG
jgi:transposase